MRWATRMGLPHRPGCLRLAIKRFLDAGAQFVFVSDPVDVPGAAAAFHMIGAELSHHGGDCSFETFLKHYQLEDPVLWGSPGSCTRRTWPTNAMTPRLDVVLRGLSMVADDEQVLELSAPLFDGLYEYLKRAATLGRNPSD